MHTVIEKCIGEGGGGELKQIHIRDQVWEIDILIGTHAPFSIKQAIKKIVPVSL